MGRSRNDLVSYLTNLISLFLHSIGVIFLFAILVYGCWSRSSLILCNRNMLRKPPLDPVMSSMSPVQDLECYFNNYNKI
jgi:hypothetical protein